MMHYKFQTFVDVSTSASSMQVLQWSVGGSDVLDRCRHLFGTYKYFKLGRIDVKFVPASTLPVDPQGLSYDADDPLTVDPRDQMNPGLVRITNGEDIFTDISRLSAEQQERVYQTMMLDPRWSKFMLQSGFRRSALPLYWQIGQLQQDLYPGATINVPYSTGTGSGLPGFDGAIAEHLYDQAAGGGIEERANDGSSGRGLFQVGHKGRLGWLPTDAYQPLPVGLDSPFYGRYRANNVPTVRVITAILPKAYKTVYYYRVFITEHVYFSGLKSVGPGFGDTNAQVLGLDQFIYSTINDRSPGTTMPSLPWNDGNMNNGDQNI